MSRYLDADVLHQIYLERGDTVAANEIYETSDDEKTVSDQGELFRQFQKAQYADPALYETAQALLAALKGIVAAVERAAARGVDLSGHVGVGNALAAIDKAEGR
jgi:hypothetical protein